MSSPQNLDESRSKSKGQLRRAKINLLSYSAINPNTRTSDKFKEELPEENTQIENIEEKEDLGEYLSEHNLPSLSQCSSPSLALRSSLPPSIPVKV